MLFHVVPCPLVFPLLPPAVHCSVPGASSFSPVGLKRVLLAAGYTAPRTRYHPVVVGPRPPIKFRYFPGGRSREERREEWCSLVRGGLPERSIKPFSWLHFGYLSFYGHRPASSSLFAIFATIATVHSGGERKQPNR